MRTFHATPHRQPSAFHISAMNHGRWLQLLEAVPGDIVAVQDVQFGDDVGTLRGGHVARGFTKLVPQIKSRGSYDTFAEGKWDFFPAVGRGRRLGFGIQLDVGDQVDILPPEFKSTQVRELSFVPHLVRR